MPKKKHYGRDAIHMVHQPEILYTVHLQDKKSTATIRIVLFLSRLQNTFTSPKEKSNFARNMIQKSIIRLMVTAITLRHFAVQ